MFRQVFDYIPPFTPKVYRAICAPTFTEAANDRTLFMVTTVLLYNRVENLSMVSTSTTYVTFNENPDVYSFHWCKTDDEIGVTIAGHPVERLDKIENYVKEKTGKNVKIIVIQDANAVCLVCKDGFTIDMYHLLTSFMSKYFPNAFKDKPLTPEEKELMRSLTMRTPNCFQEQLRKVVADESFRRFILKHQLAGFEKQMYELRVSNAAKALGTINERMRGALNQYRDLCMQKENATVILEGLKAMSAECESKSELEDYLVENRNLVNVSVDNGKISFIAKGYMIPYHFDDWENMQRNGAIYTGYRHESLTAEDIRLLLDAIFSEQHTLKLKMCASIRLDYNGSEVRADDMNFGIMGDGLADYIPNPHLTRYSCFGQNATDILDQVAMGDMIGAVECCINCMKHVNINEVTQTFRPFVQQLINFSGKCIRTPEGIDMTPVEAVGYLKEKEKANETDSSDE